MAKEHPANGGRMEEQIFGPPVALTLAPTQCQPLRHFFGKVDLNEAEYLVAQR